MKAKITIILWAICIMLAQKSQAQFSIGFDSTFVLNYPDTVYQNDTSSFIIKLKNYGGVQADSVEMYSGYKNSQGLVLNIQAETFYSGGSILSIPPNGSVTGRVVINYAANRFPVGIDVVVIWPKAFNATTIDTLEIIQSVFSPLAAAEMLRDVGFTVFPNPFSSEVRVSAAEPVKLLRIFDSKGNLVFTKYIDESIDLSLLKNGTYFFELTFKNGTHRVMKVLKE